MDPNIGGKVDCHGQLWELVKHIGQGTCSSVYEAQQHANHDGYHSNKAAIKIFKTGMQYESAGKNELELMGKINEQQLPGQVYFVNVLDYTYYQGQLCIVTDLLSANLYDIFLKAFPGEGLPFYVIRKCCLDLSQALSYLKKLWVVHSDIKPQNIMWNAMEEVFVLGDFGLSFFEGKQPYQPIQSPGYQAPEAVAWNRRLEKAATSQLEEEKVEKTFVDKASLCNCASDVWSVGCVLVYLFTEKHLPIVSFENSCDGCKQGQECSSSIGVKQMIQENGNSLTDNRVRHMESFQDLISRMLLCLPKSRIKPIEVLDHPFLQEESNDPSLCDLLFLPTRVLQLTNMLEDPSDLSPTDEYQDFVTDIQTKCSSYGAVSSIRIPSMEGDGQPASCQGKVFVEYGRAEDCEHAQMGLSRQTFDGRPVVTSFFPYCRYKQNKFF